MCELIRFCFKFSTEKKEDLNVSHDLNKMYLIWGCTFSSFLGGGGGSAGICRVFAPSVLLCFLPNLFFLFVVVFTISSAALQQKKMTNQLS